MGHELPEHRLPGRPLRILPLTGLDRGGVAGAAGPAEGVEGIVLAVQRVQLLELGQLHALGQIGYGLPLRSPRRRHPSAEVDEFLFRNVDDEMQT